MKKHAMDLHFRIAVEHIAWCISQKWAPYDVFAAIEEPAPLKPSWNDAIWAVAKASEKLDRPFTDIKFSLRRAA